MVEIYWNDLTQEKQKELIESGFDRSDDNAPLITFYSE